MWRGSMVYSWAEKEETVEDLASQVSCCQRKNIQRSHTRHLCSSKSYLSMDSADFVFSYSPDAENANSRQIIPDSSA